MAFVKIGGCLWPTWLEPGYSKGNDFINFTGDVILRKCLGTR